MSLLFYLGVWLNGRVAVSKTVGCGFESYHPCQNIQINLFFDKGGRKYALHTQQKLLFFCCSNRDVRLFVQAHAH